MDDDWAYQWWKAIWCRLFGHRYMAYDLDIDKCLCCNKQVSIDPEEVPPHG